VPRVSFLLPCRDAAAYVDEAVASILGQSDPDFEIVAVDDGSRDATRARLDTWAERDRRVRVIATTGEGIVDALCTGLSAATGDLIARMDADDVAHPDRLRAQVALLDATPELDACGTHVRYFPRDAVRDGARRYERWLNSLVTPDAIARDIFVECPIAHPTLLIRRHALETAGGWRDRGWPEDYDLILRLWSIPCPLANVPEVLLHWRERPDRLSRTHPRYHADAFRRCKAHHLARTLVGGRRVLVVGAGPVGKTFARALAAENITIAAFVDVDPRKIGQIVHGSPVVALDALEQYRDAFAVAAVGNAGARSEIREWLRGEGWGELTEFCAVA
jgi:GT2 family glycosyltransferase